MTCSPGGSRSTARISRRSRRNRCAGTSRSSRRIPRCCIARSATTSATGGPMRTWTQTSNARSEAPSSTTTLRRHIAVVTQDTSLLHRSIRDNIRYGRPDASEEEIIEAAKRAHAHEFIVGLTDREGRTGYDAHAGERGVKLSGGQRQRIAIARVLLKNAPILVLDEATSALDSEVEAAIQEQLYALMENKTVIAIAHRLSTIAALDRLIVLDQGRIVESGTHEELLARNAPYAKLWRHQSGGFLACDVDETESAENAERERALGTG